MKNPNRPDGEPRRIDPDGLQRLLSGIDRQRATTRNADAAPATPQPEPPELQEATPVPVVPTPSTPKQGGRVHPDKRGSLMLANAIAEARGEGKTISDALSYYSPELIQATLPHSEPKLIEEKSKDGLTVKRKVEEGEKVRDWIRTNGDLTLTVSSGLDAGEVVGVPYGAFPRLVLAYIITQVIAKRERRIELASHFGSFLKEVGYTGDIRGNNPSAARLKDQLNRLLRASISFEYKEGTRQSGFNSVAQMHIAPRFELWWDFKNLDQDSLFGSWIFVSEDFFDAILARPVPLKTHVLKALHKDVLALDVYMWVSYRLFGMRASSQEVLELSYSALQAQFGTNIAEENYRLFRQRLKKAFEKVGQFWTTPSSEQSLLRYEFTETGVILYTSPLLVGRGNRATHHEDAAAILTARRFDDATRRLARMQAKALYSVDHLEKQYFQWLDEKKYSPDRPPANPRAHFIAFVKRHVARNK